MESNYKKMERLGIVVLLVGLLLADQYLIFRVGRVSNLLGEGLVMFSLGFFILSFNIIFKDFMVKSTEVVEVKGNSTAD